MKKLLIVLAACAAIGANAASPAKAQNPELIYEGRMAVTALSCARWAAYLIPEKGKEAAYPKNASYADEAKRLRAFGLKNGRAFIAKAKEVTNGDAYSHLPSLYHTLDYSQGVDFAVGQLVSQVDENVARQFSMKDTFDKRSYDRDSWVLYAYRAYEDGNCDLIGEAP